MEALDLSQRIEACIRLSLFSADAHQRAAAYADLEDTLPRDEQYLPALLRLTVSGEAGPPDKSLEVRKAACVILAKEIEASWKSSPAAKHVHSARAKALVRQHLLEAMLRAGSLELVSLLSHCLSKVLARDHPHDWPDFEEQAFALLKTSSREQLFVGLSALHALGKVRQHFVGLDRRAIEATADRFLPLFAKLLQQLAGELEGNARPPAPTFAIVSALMKNLYRLLLVPSADQVDLPAICMTEAFDGALSPFCLTWLERFPQHPPKDELHKLYANGCKWVLRILNKYLVKYANTAASHEKFFAVDWSAAHGPRLWHAVLAAVSADFFPQADPRIKGLLLKSLYFLMDSELVLASQVLHAAAEAKAGLVEALERALRLTDCEQDYFSEHPQEFIRNNDEKVQNDVSLSRFYCIKVLKALSMNHEYLRAVLQLAASRLGLLLARPADSIFEREMVYSLLQIVHGSLLKEDHLSSVQNLVELHLLPDLAACSHVFLLVRLLCLLACLVSPELSPATCEACLRTCYPLARHPDQTVVTSAMLCLQKLICLRPIRQQFTPVEAQELLDLTLNTISLTEDDQLVSSLKSTLDCFASFFEKDALAISSRIADIVTKLMDHSMSLLVDDQDSREIEERSQVLTAAANCLAVLQDIVLHKAPTSQLHPLFELLQSVFVRCIEHRDESLLSECRLSSAGVYLLSSFAYRSSELAEDFFTLTTVLLYSVAPSPVCQLRLAEDSRCFKAVQSLGAAEGVLPAHSGVG